VVLDTMNTQALQPGAELPLAGLDDHYLDIEAYGAADGGVTSEGLLWLGPCGSDTKQPISRLLDTHGGHTVFVPAGSCLSTSAPTHVRARGIGAVSTADATGYRYVQVDSVDIRNQLAGGSGIDLGPQVPDDAGGVVVEVEAGASSSHLGQQFLFFYRCDASPASGGPSVGFGDPVRTLLFVELDGSSLCSQMLGGGPDDLSVKVLGYLTDALASGDAVPPAYQFDVEPGDRLNVVQPHRILDTRVGLGGPAMPAGPGETMRVTVGDAIPADTTALTLNLTAVDPASPGYVTAYSCDEPMPDTSNLNVSSINVANQATVPLGPSRQICLYSSTTTHLLADVSGTWSAGGELGLRTIEPARLLDTRVTGTPGAGQIVTVQLAGQAGVPADARAATFTLTVDRPTESGFVTVFPCDTQQPVASHLNYVAGETVANLVTVPLAADGRVCLYTEAAADLLVDVSAAYNTDEFGAHLALDGPHRWGDTRGEEPPAAGYQHVSQYLPTYLYSGQHDRVAQSQVIAGLLNVTATQATASGFVTTDCGSESAATSLGNFVPGRDSSSQALSPVVPPGSGRTCVEISAPTHLIVDSFGYFTTAIELQQQLVQPTVGT
jgi:hypothetical protein